jgi:capsular polysaccharide biosynthesis protein
LHIDDVKGFDKMDLGASFRALRRQWILALLLLFLTLAASAAGAVKLPWTYQSTGTVVLLNSKSASAADDGNPLLAFDSSLASAAEVLSLNLMSPNTVKALRARGYGESYQVMISSVTGGPILQITVSGSSKDSVQQTLNGVMGDVSSQLLTLQPGVAHQNLITALPLSESQQPTRSTSKKAKPIVAVLGLGLVLTFSIPQAVDAIVGRRRRRRRPAVPPQQAEELSDKAELARRSHAYPRDPLLLSRAAAPGRTPTERSEAGRDTPVSRGL